MRVEAPAPIAGAIAAGALAALFTVAQAALLAHVINAVFLAGISSREISRPLLWLAAATLGRMLFTAAGSWTAAAAAARVKNALRRQWTAQLERLGAAFVLRQRSGELSTVFTRGVEALDPYVGQFMPQMFLSAVQPLILWIFVLSRDWMSAVVLGLTAPLLPYFLSLIGRLAQARSQRQWTSLQRMSAYFLDVVQGLPTLRRLGRSSGEQSRIAKTSEDFRRTTNGVLRIAFLSSFTLELMSTLSTALVAVSIGLRLLKGGITFEPALMVLILAPEFFAPLRAFAARFHAGTEGVAAARRIFEVLDEAPERTPSAEVVRDPAPRPAPAGSTPFIAFDAVYYTYPGANQPSLDGLSFRLEPGQVTALVGASGAGKSTAARLLLRFMDPSAGAIRVDGRDLREMDIAEWRRMVAWVPQRPHLFHDTIAGNLRIACPEADDRAMERAAEAAQLMDWIRAQPRGWNTPIGERGARLSGGQAQRLAIARAFLRDAPVLILDEPTSYLDPRNEERIRIALHSLMAGRTVLMIAHRLRTVRDAAQVIVMDRGRVAEAGPPADLAARGGAWSAMCATAARRWAAAEGPA